MFKEWTELATSHVPVSRTIGRRIAELRRARDLSQAQVAKHLDLSRAAVTQWENGVTYPTLEGIERLAVLLDTTPWYLAFGHGTGATSVFVVQIPWTRFDADGTETEVAMVGIPAPVVAGWRVDDLRRLIAVEIADDATEGLPSDLAVVDRSNTRTGFDVKVALLFDDRVQVATLSHTPGDGTCRITVNRDTFAMAIEKVRILGRVVGKIARV